MERLTKRGGKYIYRTCRYGAYDCKTLNDYKKVYERLAEYENLELSPDHIQLMKDQLARYEAIGLTPEEITYQLENPEVETKVESVEIDIDDSDFKDALIKAFKAGIDVILTMGDEIQQTH